MLRTQQRLSTAVRCKDKCKVGFEVLSAMSVKSEVFWVVTPNVSDEHIASNFRGPMCKPTKQTISNPVSVALVNRSLYTPAVSTCKFSHFKFLGLFQKMSVTRIFYSYPPPHKEFYIIPSVLSYFWLFRLPGKYITFREALFSKRSRYSDGLDGQGLIPGRDKIVLFSTASRPALRQPPIQWVPGALSRG
jgi:hypothetical protein